MNDDPVPRGAGFFLWGERAMEVGLATSVLQPAEIGCTDVAEPTSVARGVSLRTLVVEVCILVPWTGRSN
ncbi:MAG: hypothetical protein WAZ94_00035 [Phycisphaerales bacterium]